MNIGIWESLPLMESRLRGLFARQGLDPRQITRARDAGQDLILSDREPFWGHLLPPADLYLISGLLLPRTLPEEGLVLSGGMGQEDAVTLSSIGEERAMLCLQREITLGGRVVGPFENRIPFDRNFNLYKNLAMGFALSLAQIFREEERGCDTVPLEFG